MGCKSLSRVGCKFEGPAYRVAGTHAKKPGL